MYPEGPDEGHIKSLVLYVLGNEVSVRQDDVDFDAVRAWCLEHVGDQRAFHPYHEARGGWLDYFDGDWAVSPDNAMQDGHPRWFYWFYQKKAAAKFMLTFGGIASISNPFRNHYLR